MLSLRSVNKRNLISTSVLVMVVTFMGLTRLSALKWEAYTNTNHITDVVLTEDKIYSATWGGVVEYDRLPNPEDGLAEYVKTFTGVDGLTSNDVRTLAYVESTGDVWAGTYNDGITIIRQNGVQVLNSSSGLPSNKIRRITSSQNYIYVATDQGISQFYYLPGVYFPLLLQQYDETSTQGGLISDDVNDIAIAESGYLYCATATGVSFVHTDSLDINAAWHQWRNGNSPLSGWPVLSISASSNYVAMNSMTSIHRHGANPFATDWRTWNRASGGLRDSVFTVGIKDNLTDSSIIFLSYGVWDEDTMTLSRKFSESVGFIAGDSDVYYSMPPVDQPNPTDCIYRILPNPFGLATYATWGQGIFFDGSENYQHILNNCIGFQTISDIQTDANHTMWFGSGWLSGGLTRKGTRGVSSWSDGVWTGYNSKNSPLHSDNIKSIAVDSNNRKWFGSWDISEDLGDPGAYTFDDGSNDWKRYTGLGVMQWNHESEEYSMIPGSLRILNNTIAEIAVDTSDNILISSSGAGISVLDPDYNLLGSFQMSASYSTYQSVSFIHDNGNRFFFGLNADNKLAIWNNDTLPIDQSDSWLPDIPSELRNNVIYGVVTITNIFGEEENWIASSQGLFMWDGTDWFRYDTDIKRRRYVGGGFNESETLYYVDEERLFGADREARPTAIFLDPFGRIWVGSLANGITMYDPETERFTNYFQANSPLLSNYITCFGYDPIRGKLLIGTPDGLNTLEIGIQIKTETKLRTVKAFPNPWFPDTDGEVRIINIPSLSMPVGKNVCRIYNSAGQLVIEVKENNFARFDWDGMNRNNKKCSSGIYFFVVTDAKGVTGRGKLALIRGERNN